jgi:hypothetical protein
MCNIINRWIYKYSESPFLSIFGSVVSCSCMYTYVCCNFASWNMLFLIGSTLAVLNQNAHGEQEITAIEFSVILNILLFCTDLELESGLYSSVLFSNFVSFSYPPPPRHSVILFIIETEFLNFKGALKSIPPAYVAWRAGTWQPNSFLVPSPHKLFYAPEAHIMYLTVVSWFLISFVMGGGGRPFTQVGPYRKCCHVQTRAHGQVLLVSLNVGIYHRRIIYLMFTDQVHSMYRQFSAYTHAASLRPSIFPRKFVFICIVLSNLSVNTVQNTLQYTLVYGTHSGGCWSERSKVARELEHKVFCLVSLVLNEFFVKRAENDSPYCFSWLGMSICYFSSISVLLYMYIHNWVQIMFKIWYITIILSYLLLCAVHLMQGFV